MTLSKSEKRILRQNEKKAKDADKSARLGASIEIPDKFVRITEPPPLAKVPRSVNPDQYKETYFSWCETKSDREGFWSWGENRDWTQEEFDETIAKHCNDLGLCSWQEVEQMTYNGKGKFRKRSNKYQEIATVCDEALERWLEDEIRCQFEEVFKLRLSSLERIWGIRMKHHFYIIWYEREHKINPSS